MRSPDSIIVNQIDHPAFSRRWRSSLQNVRVLRWADLGSQHHLLMAKFRLKIAKVRKEERGRVRFEVSKLKDLQVRNAFKLALHKRFEGLQQLMEEEELPLDDEWRLIEQGYVETCKQVLGRAKANRKEWISKETWQIIEPLKLARNTTNMVRTRKQKKDANKRFQELNREVKRRCRRDRGVYVESEAERAEEAGKRGDVRALFEITRKLSGKFQNTWKPVRTMEACCSGQQRRRCTCGGGTFKQCLTTKSRSARQRWSQMTSLTSGQVASHELKSRIL